MLDTSPRWLGWIFLMWSAPTWAQGTPPPAAVVICPPLAGLSDAPAKGPEPRPFTDAEQSQLAALQTNPSAGARYKAAQLYSAANQLPAAARGFCEVVEREHGSELGRYATTLLWDALSSLQEYDALEKVMTRHCPWMKDPETLEQCAKLRWQLGRRKVERLEKEKKFREAADLAVRLASAPDAKRRPADELVYNAARLYEQAEDLPASRATWQMFLKKYPNSPLKKSAAEHLLRIESQ